MMDLSTGFILAAVVATIIVGLTKGGLVGVGVLAMPVFALGAPPMQAAAILLPILMVQDLIGVWAFRRNWNRHIVAVMLPGCVIGVAGGWLFAELVAVDMIMAVVGGIAMVFGLWRLWVERGGRIVAASDSPGWVGTLFGIATGFTSQIAHAGGPPFQMWVIPRKLPHIEFAGTTAVLFTIVNWMKVPAYVALGQFSRQNLVIAGWLMPLAIASTFAGVWLVRRISGRLFYVMVNILLLLLGAKLLAEAALG